MSSKSSRSQFIEKLHTLLEHPLDPSSLRWVGEDAFEITCNDVRARHALSPSWEFRSLSSFIRQLSYYNFKRLSDRRRSSERRSAASGFIVFSHPSGLFIQGDSTRLGGIVRKTRNRPEKSGGRRNSTASINSAQPIDEEEQQQYSERHQDHEQDQEEFHHQQMMQQQHQQNQNPSWPISIHDSARHLPNVNEYPEDRRQLPHFSHPPAFQSNFPSVRNIQSGGEPAWRAYNAAPPAWDESGERPQLPRRSSDYGSNSLPPLSPKSKGPNRNPLIQGESDILNSRDHYQSPYPPPTFEADYSYSAPNDQVGSPNSHHSHHSHPELSPHQSPLHSNHLLLHRNSLPNPAPLPHHLQGHDQNQLPPFVSNGLNHHHSHSHPSGVDLDSRIQQSTAPVRSFSQPQINQLPPHYYHSPDLQSTPLPGSPPHWQSPKSFPLSLSASEGMRPGNVLPSLLNGTGYEMYGDQRN